jgi:metallo-beta-lactamase family protein
VLRDAAHLQEEDADHATTHGYSRHHPPVPLFNAADAEQAITLLQPIPTETAHDVGSASVTLRPAGHILGSATVEVRSSGGSLGFTGDLGRVDHPLLKPPASAPAVDVMLVESTYGDRRHPPRDLAVMAEPIRRTIDRGGVVLAPAFAIDRTPVLLMALKSLVNSHQLPMMPVYVDSPMALAALEVYRAAVREHSGEIRDDLAAAPGDDPFDPGDLHLVHSVEESKRLNDPRRPCVIISAAGMATGGRVVHHLAHLAPDPRNLILLPGFQVPGTRGRALQDGERAIKMFGGYVPVRAEVSTAEVLSAHADADGLLAWLKTASAPPDMCFVVHGEESASTALAARISAELYWGAVVPRHGERILF